MISPASMSCTPFCIVCFFNLRSAECVCSYYHGLRVCYKQTNKKKYCMRWLLWCFCLLAESYKTINHYHYFAVKSKAPCWTQQHTQFSLVMFEPGLSQMQLQKSLEQYQKIPKIPKSLVVKHKTGVGMINVKNRTKYHLQTKLK